MLWTYGLIYVVPVSVVVGVGLGDYWSLLTLALVFGIVPIVDEIVDLDTDNPEPSEARARLETPWFHRLARAWTPVYLATLGWGLWQYGSASLSPVETAGLCCPSVCVEGSASGPPTS
jgi:hypothetical protein